MYPHTRNQQGNTTVAAIVLSAILLGTSMSLLTSTTQTLINTYNIRNAQSAYFESEGNLEYALYLYSGHKLGFETSSNPDEACITEPGNTSKDSWCFKSRIQNDSFVNMPERSVASIGLYNDTSSADNVPTASDLKNITMNTDFKLELFIIEDSSADKNAVSEGDIRVTEFTGFTENSKVKSTDSDALKITSGFSTYLKSLKDASADYKITGDDGIWDTGEKVYFDTDQNNTVSPGDIRVTRFGDKAPGTSVTNTDIDNNSTLTLNVASNLGVSCITSDCTSYNYAKIYSTTIGSIKLTSQVLRGTDTVPDTWIHTFSKNEFQGKDAENPLSIDKWYQENTGIIATRGRTLDQVFNAHADINLNWYDAVISGTNYTTTTPRTNYISGYKPEPQEPVLQIITDNTALFYKISVSNNSSQPTSTKTELIATNSQGQSEQTVKITLDQNEIVPIFGSANVVH